MRSAGGLLLLVGCNTAFGLEPTAILDAPDPLLIDAPPPDRDRDGIDDHEDPCIASIADRLVDWDGDSFVNESDGCPFDTDGVSEPDGDGDGVWNICDPLLTAGGDRMRCVMAFQNPTITREVFVPRDGDPAVWNFLQTFTLGGEGTGTLVAAETFEAPVATSFDLPLQIGMPNAAASFTLWLSTGDLAGPGDVGCEARGDATTATVALRGTSMEMPVNGAALQELTRIQATLLHGVVGRNNVRCLFQFGTSTSAGISAEVAISARGRIGFGISALSTKIFGLTILERDDAPTL